MGNSNSANNPIPATFTVLQNGQALLIGGAAGMVIKWAVDNHARINQTQKGRIELHIGPSSQPGSMSLVGYIFDLVGQLVTGPG